MHNLLGQVILVTSYNYCNALYYRVMIYYEII